MSDTTSVPAATQPPKLPKAEQGESLKAADLAGPRQARPITTPGIIPALTARTRNERVSHPAGLRNVGISPLLG